ncbi:MAG: GTPase ObgE [Myxococcales bacterium]|jgi:GTP-binding protein
MKFLDSSVVKILAGRGGNGCVAFRREKFVPHGGPSGGDGGKGGDIIFETDPGLSTLIEFAHKPSLTAEGGENGRGKDQYGKGGDDLVVRVPVGTQVFDHDSGALIVDLDAVTSRAIVGRGGRGGRGNIHFASPVDRAPRRADPGQEGEARTLRLELKVLADVGLLGFPNVGKSTFIRAVSKARPKVAEYPFTTLIPHLGVVCLDDDTIFVIADIPGLLPGAADGVGLGLLFLKHVERTRVLLHLVTLDASEDRDPVSDYDALLNELQRFDPQLASRPQVVALSKADLPDVLEAYEDIRSRFAEKGVECLLVSAATGHGVREVLNALAVRLAKGKPQDIDS